ncbi:MAG: DUF6015 family protein [Thermoplasmata archaeon]
MTYTGSETDVEANNRRFSSFANRNPNNYVSPRILSNAIIYTCMKKGMKISKEAADSIASQAMAFFGFENECLDNYLENEDRQNMYLLEDLGLVKVESDLVYLSDGTSWRISKFLLNKNKIINFGNRLDELVNNPLFIYDSLDNHIWQRKDEKSI